MALILHCLLLLLTLLIVTTELTLKAHHLVLFTPDEQVLSAEYKNDQEGDQRYKE